MSSNVMSTLKHHLFDAQIINNLDRLKYKLGIVSDELLIEYLLCLVQDEFNNNRCSSIVDNESYIKKLFDCINLFIIEDRNMDINYVNKKLKHIIKHTDVNIFGHNRKKYLGLLKLYWINVDKQNNKKNNPKKMKEEDTDIYRLYMNYGEGYEMIYATKRPKTIFEVLDHYILEKPDYMITWIIKESSEDRDNCYCLFGREPEKYIKCKEEILDKKRLKDNNKHICELDQVFVCDESNMHNVKKINCKLV